MSDRFDVKANDLAVSSRRTSCVKLKENIFKALNCAYKLGLKHGLDIGDNDAKFWLKCMSAANSAGNKLFKAAVIREGKDSK